VDGCPALVLELVEGETLAERLARSPVRLAEALAIARQIAIVEHWLEELKTRVP
jgi:hypothetical protein